MSGRNHSEVQGNTSGLGASELRALQRLYRRKVPVDQLITSELARQLCECSHRTHRQVGVLVDRNGAVETVLIGDASFLMLPDLGRLRAARGRFRGVRLLHTHLRQEELTRDDLVDLTRLRLDMIAAVCVRPDGLPGPIHYAHCWPSHGSSEIPPYQVYGPTALHQLDCNPAELLPRVEAEFTRATRMRPVEAKDGRAILVHVCRHREAADAEASLAELAELAKSAGVEVAESILQVRAQLDPKFIVGKGKLEDIVLLAMQHDCEVVIFDCDLRPAQGAALGSMTDLKVLDRTQLILDIFAQRAESRDGKLQVELAQMRYLLPRLGTRDDALSRLTGGIGGRGPGETKLEIGKRRARERIHALERQLKALRGQREQRRVRRKRRDVPVIAIIGYTNAGKSTLLNTLTLDHTLAEDRLFATLDTRSRRLRFPEEREVVITDTVGFIRNLPKELFNAFRATFEEAQDANLLLEVVDLSDPAHPDHMHATEELLSRLQLSEIPRLRVMNKMDRVSADYAHLLGSRHRALAVSASDRETLRPLLEQMEAMLFLANSGEHSHSPSLQRDALPSASEDIVAAS